MAKLSALLRYPQFWIAFLVSALIVIGLETFLLSLWALPIIGYRIPYMGEIDVLDYLFVAGFALVFGFGTALFFLEKRHGKGACTVEAAGGLMAFLTLLCPVCPVFFLAYFGSSATVMAIAPYFWPLRGVALVLVLIGTALLWRRLDAASVPQAGVSGHVVFQSVLAVMATLFLLGNQALALQAGESLLGSGAGGAVKLSGNFAADIGALVTPSSLPFYGPELGLDFSSIENINTSIKKMATMAPKQGKNPIELTEEEMKRYVKIGTEPLITCEFCCGVKTLVREDGSPTCGCAHSIGMRGMAAYLIRNHPEITDEEISYEIARQKGLYFPVQMQKRMAEQLSGEAKDFTPDIKYLTMHLSPSELSGLQVAARESGFEPTEAPSMVGGC